MPTSRQTCHEVVQITEGTSWFSRSKRPTWCKKRTTTIETAHRHEHILDGKSRSSWKGGPLTVAVQFARYFLIYMGICLRCSLNYGIFNIVRRTLSSSGCLILWSLRMRQRTLFQFPFTPLVPSMKNKPVTWCNLTPYWGFINIISMAWCRGSIF